VRIRQAVGAELALLVAATAVVAFYWWTASAGWTDPGGRQAGLYDLLARGLARGQLHLPVEPNPELFERTDPYEPAQHVGANLEDASLYHGRYYLYFGIVPGLALFLPWRLLTATDLPQPAAAFLFACAGFLFSALLLRKLLREHLEPVPQAARLVAFLVLGTTNVAPFLLRSGNVYEVAVAAGLCFSSAAAWLSAGAGDSPRLARAALAGACLGLAAGCRPNLVVIAPLLALLPRAPASSQAAPRLKRAAAALLPLAGCLLLLGWYNQARFGAWTEFGTRYQLVGARRISRFDPRTIAPVLYYEFLAPASLSSEFPPLRAYHPWPFGPRIPDGYFIDERTTGALLHAPFLLVLCGGPWILRRLPLRDGLLLKRRLLVLVAAGLLLPLLTSFAFASATMRFEADFLGFLLVPALVLWSALLARPRRGRWLSIAAAAVLFPWAVLAAVSLSIAGGDRDLRQLDPPLFRALERGWEPVRVALERVFDRDARAVVRLRVAFSARPVSAREPLLSWGEADRYDVLWLRQTGNGELVLQLDTATGRGEGSPPADSGTIRVEPHAFHEVTVDLDRVRRRVAVCIDRQPPLELTGRLVGLNPNRLWIGRGPRGRDAPEIGAFSGTAIPESMLLAGDAGLDALPAVAAQPAILVQDRQGRPAVGPGQLRLVAGRRGADIWTQRGWRWIPIGSPEAIRLDHTLEPVRRGVVAPVLVSGDAGGADAVFARYLGERRVVLLLARWSGSWSIRATTPAIDVGPLQVTFDRVAGRATVAAGGHAVLDAAADLLPILPGRLSVARLPAGLPPPAGGGPATSPRAPSAGVSRSGARTGSGGE